MPSPPNGQLPQDAACVHPPLVRQSTSYRVTCVYPFPHSEGFLMKAKLVAHISGPLPSRGRKSVGKPWGVARPRRGGGEGKAGDTTFPGLKCQQQKCPETWL